MFYIYDGKTKEFLKETQGQPNPLKKGEFLKPNFSVETAPKIEEGKHPVLEGAAWVNKTDNRDLDAWLTLDASKVPFELGDELTADMTKLDPSALSAPTWNVNKWEEDTGELQDQARANFVIMTDAHIQAEVDKYNKDNNVLFGSVHNCSTYIMVDTYPHQAFCIAIINWNAEVWETVRAIDTLPTDEEFQAVLDSVPFNG